MSNPLAADLDHILDHTRDLWDEIRGEQLFITGGTGFFGCWLLESFLWANQKLKIDSRVTVLTRSPAAFLAKTPHLAQADNVTLLAGDIRTFAFPQGRFSHVLHAATDASAKLNAENPLLMLDTIVSGTRHTLDFASQSGAKKFLLTSSGAIYGKQPPEVTHIPEDYTGAPDSLDPTSAYGQGKRMAEHLCAQYARTDSLQTKIARCFAFVGPYLPLEIHFAIGNFIRDGLNGGPIIVQGDGTPQRSYLYAADLAIWLWTILFNGQHLRPYNVGSEENVSIAETAHTVSQNMGQVEIVIQGTRNHLAPVHQYVPSTKRAQKELGLRDYFKLDEKIQHTIKWIR